MSEKEPHFSMPTWTVEQERELLLLADELDEVWESFVSGDGPGVIPVSMCRDWRDRVLKIVDKGERQCPNS